MLISKAKGSRIPLIADGVYMGVCSRIIDLGTQSDTYGQKQKVRIVWDLIGETYQYKEETLQRRISRTFTNSLDEKSNLCKALTAWRGKIFSDEDLKGFDLTKILGAGVQLQILTKTSKGGDPYSSIESYMPLPKGQKAPAVETLLFDMDNPDTYEAFSKLSSGTQKAIAAAPEFAYTGLSLAAPGAGAVSYASGNASDFEEVDADGDLPF